MDITPNPKGNDYQVVAEPKVVGKRKWLRKWLKVVLVMIALPLLMAVVAGIQAWGVYRQAIAMETTARQISGQMQSQDLPALKSSLGQLSSQIQSTQISYRRLSWLKIIPLAGAYYQDGERTVNAGLHAVGAGQILIDAIEPYADVLGFQGSGSFTGGTAEDRIIVILKTLEKVTPKLDDVAKELAIVDQNLQVINPKRYPFTVKSKNLAEELTQIREAVHSVTAAITDAKPALEALPKLAGMEGEKKYMVLFHNDGELRGTGGFMTAYAIMRVDSGRVSAERSSDIYELDSKFRERIQPPEPIRKNLNVKYWYLRDMNISPDFKQNMDLFSSYYQNIPGEPKIDGIIGVDTNVLVDILKVLGPIDVPGFGRFSTDNEPRCNCPQVVYQLELIADRPVATLVDSRKGVLGPLMREIIFKAYASPKAWWDDLLKVFIDDVSAKHLVFYFFDEQFQQAAEKLNAAGRIADTDGDYLLVSDVNFGGAKSNFFVEQDVVGKLEMAPDGTMKRTLTVSYANTAPPSNCNLEAGQLCLNAPMTNLVRIFVPKGSQLVEAVGLDESAVVKEENGKTVFEGFLRINPQSRAKTIYTYILPWKSKHAPGTMLVQHQVGKETSHYQLELPDRVEEFELVGDKKLVFSW